MLENVADFVLNGGRAREEGKLVQDRSFFGAIRFYCSTSAGDEGETGRNHRWGAMNLPGDEARVGPEGSGMQVERRSKTRRFRLLF